MIALPSTMDWISMPQGVLMTGFLPLQQFGDLLKGREFVLVSVQVHLQTIKDFLFDTSKYISLLQTHLI